MERTTLSSKGQMIVPKRIRERLALKPGMALVVQHIDARSFKVELAATLSRAEQVDRLAGSLARYSRGKRGSSQSDDKAIMRVVGADDERTKRKTARRRPL